LRKIKQSILSGWSVPKASRANSIRWGSPKAYNIQEIQSWTLISIRPSILAISQSLKP
jgi:hypothetical protein